MEKRSGRPVAAVRPVAAPPGPTDFRARYWTVYLTVVIVTVAVTVGIASATVGAASAIVTDAAHVFRPIADFRIIGTVPVSVTLVRFPTFFRDASAHSREIDNLYN